MLHIPAALLTIAHPLYSRYNQVHLPDYYDGRKCAPTLVRSLRNRSERALSQGLSMWAGAAAVVGGAAYYIYNRL